MITVSWSLPKARVAITVLRQLWWMSTIGVNAQLQPSARDSRAADQTHLSGGVGVGSGGGLQRRGDERAVGAGAVAAGLDVRGHQQRHLRPALSVPDVGLDAGRVGVVVAHTARVVGVDDVVDEVVVEPVVQVDEQLPDLLVLRSIASMVLRTQAIAPSSNPYGAAVRSGCGSAFTYAFSHGCYHPAIICQKLPSAAASWHDQRCPTVAGAPLRPARSLPRTGSGSPACELCTRQLDRRRVVGSHR